MLHPVTYVIGMQPILVTLPRYQICLSNEYIYILFLYASANVSRGFQSDDNQLGDTKLHWDLSSRVWNINGTLQGGYWQ